MNETRQFHSEIGRASWASSRALVKFSTETKAATQADAFASKMAVDIHPLVENAHHFDRSRSVYSIEENVRSGSAFEVAGANVLDASALLASSREILANGGNLPDIT